MSIVFAVLLFLIFCALIFVGRSITAFNNNFVKAVTHFNKIEAMKAKK